MFTLSNFARNKMRPISTNAFKGLVAPSFARPSAVPLFRPIPRPITTIQQRKYSISPISFTPVRSILPTVRIPTICVSQFKRIAPTVPCSLAGAPMLKQILDKRVEESRTESIRLGHIGPDDITAFANDDRHLELIDYVESDDQVQNIRQVQTIILKDAHTAKFYLRFMLQEVQDAEEVFDLVINKITDMIKTTEDPRSRDIYQTYLSRIDEEREVLRRHSDTAMQAALPIANIQRRVDRVIDENNNDGGLDAEFERLSGQYDLIHEQLLNIVEIVERMDGISVIASDILENIVQEMIAEEEEALRQEQRKNNMFEQLDKKQAQHISKQNTSHTASSE